MNVNIGVVSVTFTITLGLILAGCIIPNVFAQSDVPDFSNLFGGSTSSQDKDQYTNVVVNQTTGLSKFTNTQYGFEFEFPSTWEVLSPYSSGINMEGIPIQVASIRSTLDEGIHDLLTISILKPSKYLDTDAMEVKTSNLTPQEHAKIVTDLLPEHGFKVVRENSVNVSGMPAYRIEYTTYEYETEVFVVKPDGTLYTLEFGTPMLRAPESLPVFNKMVESFKFVNASTLTNESKLTSNNQTQTPSINSPNQQSAFNTPTDNAASDSGGVNTPQPISPIQQFNQDVGSGPICCDVGGASTTTTPVGGVASATELGDDNTPVTTTDDDKKDDNSNDDNSNRNDDEEDSDNNDKND